MPKKILIVEDDPKIAELIALYLAKEGYELYHAYSGGQVMEIFAQSSPHLVLLDIMLPEKDGYQVCREIRQNSQVPVIMLTAKSETLDKVLGLEIGADDYIVKPFDPHELIARVKAVLRRFEKPHENQINYPNILINQTMRSVTYHGEEVDFTPKEFDLLFFLASNPNRVFTRDELLDKIWGFEFVGDTRTVDVHMKRIREKLPLAEKWTLKTVWGVGYVFRDDAHA